MRSWVLAVALAGCTTSFDAPFASRPLPQALPGDVFDTLKDPAAAHAELCDHDPADTTFPAQADRITNRFCQDVQGGVVPTPTGLADLLTVLGLDFKDRTAGNGTNGNPAFAILGHSSALTAREVSSITPTAFVFTPLNPDGSVPNDYIFLAYDPGESFVEVASYSPADMQVNFYLVLFDKACTHAAGGCGPTDMLTPKQTTGWSNVRIYESTTALDNTIADCRQCHIGAGKDVPDTGDPLILRMQELEAPHTHWFSSSTTGGQALLADFRAAHGTDEDYGAIPAALIDSSDPDQMAAFIKAAGFANQPNPFPSQEIETEISGLYAKQPWTNVPMGWSKTWNGVFDAATNGQAIAAPYHDVKVTDPDKLAHMTQLYTDWKSGKSAELTEDIREVLLDPGLADMGFAAPPGLGGRALLVQQCQQCHHARLDPTISRDRFLVDQLDSMSRAEKDLAIQRLQLPTDTRLTMPPQLFRLPTDAERQLMIEELQK
ncbi:MAG: hypothetical protein ACM31C_17730 [Acidobacteriota bacterium]